MKIKPVLLLILIPSLTFASIKDSSYVGFIPSAILGLNISQVALSNWTKGGSNSLTWTATGQFGMGFKDKGYTVKNNMKVAFGRTKLGSEAFRTNENELYIENIFSKKIGWDVDPFLSNNFRTALTSGYSYKKKEPEKIVKFFDPAYLTQSLGFTFDKGKKFNTRMGAAIQETFTNEFRQYSDNKETENKKEAFKLETGIESVTSAEILVDMNIVYKGSFRFFTRFEHLDVWDLRFDNTIVAKVNSWLNVNFNYVFVYEKNQSLTAQMKESLQLGIIYTII